MMIPTPLPTASARHVPALTALEHQGTRQPNTSPLGLGPYSDECISVQHCAAGTFQTKRILHRSSLAYTPRPAHRLTP